jgi:hypothetical protein
MNQIIKTPAAELVDAEGNAFTRERVTFHSPGKEACP